MGSVAVDRKRRSDAFGSAVQAADVAGSYTGCYGIIGAILSQAEDVERGDASGLCDNEVLRPVSGATRKRRAPRELVRTDASGQFAVVVDGDGVIISTILRFLFDDTGAVDIRALNAFVVLVASVFANVTCEGRSGKPERMDAIRSFINSYRALCLGYIGRKAENGLRSLLRAPLEVTPGTAIAQGRALGEAFNGLATRWFSVQGLLASNDMIQRFLETNSRAMRSGRLLGLPGLSQDGIASTDEADVLLSLLMRLAATEELRDVFASEAPDARFRAEAFFYAFAGHANLELMQTLYAESVPTADASLLSGGEIGLTQRLRANRFRVQSGLFVLKGARFSSRTNKDHNGIPRGTGSFMEFYEPRPGSGKWRLYAYAERPIQYAFAGASRVGTVGISFNRPPDADAREDEEEYPNHVPVEMSWLPENYPVLLAFHTVVTRIALMRVLRATAEGPLMRYFRKKPESRQDLFVALGQLAAAIVAYRSTRYVYTSIISMATAFNTPAKRTEAMRIANAAKGMDNSAPVPDEEVYAALGITAPAFELYARSTATWGAVEFGFTAFPPAKVVRDFSQTSRNPLLADFPDVLYYKTGRPFFWAVQAPDLRTIRVPRDSRKVFIDDVFELDDVRKVLSMIGLGIRGVENTELGRREGDYLAEEVPKDATAADARFLDLAAYEQLVRDGIQEAKRITPPTFSRF